MFATNTFMELVDQAKNVYTGAAILLLWGLVAFYAGKMKGVKKGIMRGRTQFRLEALRKVAETMCGVKEQIDDSWPVEQQDGLVSEFTLILKSTYPVWKGQSEPPQQ